ncbi:MAG: NAD(P)-dependent alcohol dehydrogenase [Thermoleophilia bacterium]|nr:NAD(P)-dependent alcohol dehydrogenase [Thermoleophilia bacterium]
MFDRYGPPEVLQIADVERPGPKEDEVLVRVHATTASRTDAGLRSAEYFVARVFTGLLRPRRNVVGLEFAGEVEAVGAAVTEFAAGDRVFGIRSGSNAEYVCVRESGVIAHLPAGLSFEQAAAVADGALSAVSLLRTAGVGDGTKLLVYGASGSIGTAAVQLAKHLGAHVTAVCNTPNLELVRSLGADDVVDYLREDFTRRGRTYDVVLDAAGKTTFLRSRRALKRGGLYVTTDPGFLWHDAVVTLATKLGARRKAKLGIVRYRKDDLRAVRELLERGAYRPVIDRTYPLDEVVDAHRYVDTHQKAGNVVLTIGGTG